MVDVLNRSTAEKSRSGVNMPLLDPGTMNVLSHPRGKDRLPVEMFLTVLGPESEETRRALAQMQTRSNKKKANHSPSDDEIEAESVSDSKLLAKLTIGGLVFMGGKWVDITTDNAFDLYYAVMPFRGQVMAFILDVGNFTRG